MKPFMFEPPILPGEFLFPTEYLSIAASGLWPDLEPWSFLAHSMGQSLIYFGDMSLKFPNLKLIPFAYINDQSGHYNDGWIVLACFDGSNSSGDPRVLIYDASTRRSPDENFVFQDFSAWLTSAEAETAQFRVERSERDR